MQPFTHYVGIDWSGAKGARHKGLMVSLCKKGNEAPSLVDPPSGKPTWSRIECGQWIENGCGLSSNARVLVGIDAAFGMPYLDQDTYFEDKEIGSHAFDVWAEIARLCHQTEDYFGGPFIDALSDHFHQHGGRRGSSYSRRMRVAENQCRHARIGPCESVFNLVGASQVGKSALSTMNMLHNLNEKQQVSIWPFDNIDNAQVCLVEIYAAVFAKMGNNRGKMNNIDSLNTALSHLGSLSFKSTLPGKADDAADAIITAAGLRCIAHDRKYWHPPQLSTKVRRTEGWIFGVV